MHVAKTQNIQLFKNIFYESFFLIRLMLINSLTRYKTFLEHNSQLDIS